MTSRPRQQKAFAGAAVLASALCCTAPAFAQSASQLFYERTVMSAADSRCRLFDRPTSSALQAGAAQARGAALRAGMTTKQLASATESFNAQTRSAVPQDLLAASHKSGWMLRFSAEAADALAELDPCEAAAVHFLFASREGDSVRRGLCEGRRLRRRTGVPTRRRALRRLVYSPFVSLGELKATTLPPNSGGG